MSEVSVSSVGVAGGAERTIRGMCKNYMDLISECCVNDQALARFKGNMHSVLNEEVGMKIPEDVAIVLDLTTNRWATLYVMTEDEKIAISEESLGVTIERFPTDEDVKTQSVKVKDFTEVSVSIRDELKRDGVKAVLELPFFDVHTDPMTDIKFSDDAEIILSSC